MFKIQNKSDRPEYLFILREPALLALQLVQLRDGDDVTSGRSGEEASARAVDRHLAAGRGCQVVPELRQVFQHHQVQYELQYTCIYSIDFCR